jgi:hypothetical protein
VPKTSTWNAFLDWIKGVPIDGTGSLFVTGLSSVTGIPCGKNEKVD